MVKTVAFIFIFKNMIQSHCACVLNKCHVSLPKMLLLVNKKMKKTNMKLETQHKMCF